MIHNIWYSVRILSSCRRRHPHNQHQRYHLRYLVLCTPMLLCAINNVGIIYFLSDVYGWWLCAVEWEMVYTSNNIERQIDGKNFSGKAEKMRAQTTANKTTDVVALAYTDVGTDKKKSNQIKRQTPKWWNRINWLRETDAQRQKEQETDMMEWICISDLPVYRWLR